MEFTVQALGDAVEVRVKVDHLVQFFAHGSTTLLLRGRTTAKHFYFPCGKEKPNLHGPMLSRCNLRSSTLDLILRSGKPDAEKFSGVGCPVVETKGKRKGSRPCRET